MNNSSWKLGRRIVALLGAALAALSLVWLLALSLDASIPLDAVRGSLERAASQSLGRQVRIRGPIALRPTLRPALIVRDVHIVDPRDRRGADLLQAERAEARLGLTALLTGRLHIVRLRVKDVRIHLETRDDGSLNWRLDEAVPAAERGPAAAPFIGQQELQHLALRNIVLSYTDARTERSHQFSFDELNGEALREQPLHLQVRGSVHHQAYVAELSGGTLSALLAASGPWPLHVTTRFAGAVFTLDGTWHTARDKRRPGLAFELRAVWPEAPDRPPATAAAVVRGRLKISDAGLVLTDLAARIGQTTLEGWVSARLDQEPPYLRSELRVAEFDAASLSALMARFESGASARPRGAEQRQAEGPVPGWLEAVDMDAGIRVAKFLHAPVPVNDGELALSLRGGVLTAPLGLNVAGVPLRGRLVMDSRAAGPELSVVLTARNARVERLAESLTGSAGMRGVIERIEFQAALRGTPGPDVLKRLALDLRLRGAGLSYGHVPGGRPVGLRLDAMSVSAAAGKALSGTAQGALREVPFAAAFTGPRLESLMTVGEPRPVTLSASGAGAELKINGRLADPRTWAESRLDFELSGQRLGDLAAWFGVSPCAEASYSARAELAFAGGGGRLQSLELRTGRTRLEAELDWSGGRQGAPAQASLNVDALDPADLAAFVPLLRADEADADHRRVMIDIPVLPRPVAIPDTDLRLAIARLLLSPVDITDVSLSGGFRGGRLQRSPFEAQIGSSRFQGHLEPSGAVTDVVFTVDDDAGDSGNRLEELFSTALQWAESVAIVPLQWLFERKLSDDRTDGCPEATKGLSAAGKR